MDRAPALDRRSPQESIFESEIYVRLRIILLTPGVSVVSEWMNVMPWEFPVALMGGPTSSPTKVPREN